MRLEKKIAIVTGGTRGLGRAIARAFADEGAMVICAARNCPDREEGGLHYRQADVTDPDSVRELCDDVASSFGQIDVLVANVGISRDGKITKLSREDWDAVISTNLTGTFNSTRAVAPYMAERGWGRIINVSSVLGTRAVIGAGAYCATKAAIEMLTRVSAIELGGKGITVNCLAPGFLDEGMAKSLARNTKVWDAYQSRFVLGRPGATSEAAAAAVFLASEDSSYVNGHVLEVSGGLLWV